MKYVLSSLCVLAAVVSLAWVNGADESSKTKSTKTKPTAAAETLLPANAVVAMTFDGSAAHLPALKETAAWKALEETELTARLLDIGQMFASAAGPQSGELAREAIEHVRSHGLSMAISLSGSGKDLAPYGIVVLHDAAPFADELISMIRDLAEREGEIVVEKTLDGRVVTVFPTPVPDAEVSMWAESGHLVVAAGMNACRQVIATSSGKTDNITKNPKWTELRKSDKYTVDAFAWIDTGSLLDQFGDMPLPPTPSGEQMSIRDLTSMLGFSNIRELTGQSGYSGAQTWSDVRLSADGPLTGLAALLQQRTLSLAELPPMPKAVTGFGAATFDAATTYDTVLDTVRKIFQRVDPKSEGQLDQGLAEMEKVFGGDPRKELLAGLGDVWCVYADSAAMPIPIGFAPVAAVSVKDKGILISGLGKLMEVVQRAAGNEHFTVRQTNKDNREYFSFNLSGMPFVPTIMVTDKWLVASLTPASAQSFAQRENGKLPGWKPVDQVAEALKELPQEFSSITVTDPAPGYQQILLWAPMGLNLLQQEVLPTMAGGSLEMPFAAEDLPAVELVTEPMFPNVSVGFSTKTGIGSTSRQSVPSNPFGSVSSGVAVPVLIALLLPAVQQAREAARRTQSKNNLKWLALAMHNYHDTYNTFPRGTVENDDLEPDERLSWAYSLLPFLEQSNLYNQMNADSGWESEANAEARAIAVVLFHNPSQSGQRTNPSAGDYIGIAGIGPDAASLENNDPKAGIFGYDRETNFRDITDGTANTLMIGDASEPNVSFLAGGKATIRGFSQKPYINGPDGIGSPHVGGAQFALADGSVRFISENIDEGVLEALATKAGGEVVGDF